MIQAERPPPRAQFPGRPAGVRATNSIPTLLQGSFRKGKVRLEMKRGDPLPPLFAPLAQYFVYYWGWGGRSKGSCRKQLNSQTTDSHSAGEPLILGEAVETLLDGLPQLGGTSGSSGRPKEGRVWRETRRGGLYDGKPGLTVSVCGASPT